MLYINNAKIKYFLKFLLLISIFGVFNIVVNNNNNHEVVNNISPIPITTGRQLLSKTQVNCALQPSQLQCQLASNKPAAHYILGYGSLINKKSRHMTNPTGGAVPVIVNNYKRIWSYSQPERKMTAVGAVEKQNGRLNGIMVKVDPKALPKFDEREKRYTRKEVNHKNLQIYPKRNGIGFVLRPQDKVWIYIVDQANRPTKDLPIAQSYVDVILAGCLRFGKKFAKACIADTGRWTNRDQPGQQVWINDRDQPRIYDKNFVDDMTKMKIDKLLNEAVPNALKLRKNV